MSSSLWVPGKDLFLVGSYPVSTVALAIPVHLPARLVSVEEKEEVEIVWLPVEARYPEAARQGYPAQMLLVIGSVAKHFGNLRPTAWLQGSISK